MNTINHQHLYYFYTIAKAGSISKACETLHLAQSTLSAQLKLLETSLGRRLFDRRNRRLFLTDDGRLVLDYAQSIFEISRELQDAMRDRPQAGTLAIQVGVLNATPKAFGHALLEALLKCPTLNHVSVQEGGTNELLIGLQQHKLDIVLANTGMQGQSPGELVNHLICKIPVVLEAAPHLVKRCRKIPEDLENLPLILPSAPSSIRQQICDALELWDIKPKVIAEVQDMELARRLALSGHGIATLNEYTVAASLPSRGLKIIDMGGALDIHETIYLITRKRKWPNPLVAQLIRGLRESFKKTADSDEKQDHRKVDI